MTIDICPGCGKPAHASETTDDGYHEACIAAWCTAMTSRQISIAVGRFARSRRDIDVIAAIESRDATAITQAHTAYLQSDAYREMISDMTVDEHRR